MRRYENQILEWYPVGTAVGNVRNQGPNLVEPVQLPAS